MLQRITGSLKATPMPKLMRMSMTSPLPLRALTLHSSLSPLPPLLVPPPPPTGSGGPEGTAQNVVKPIIPDFKWRLLIAYDGTHYAGWQYQLIHPTIQRSLEQALVKITKLDRKELLLYGAGRTDAGVHAWGQVAHFVTPFNYDSLDHLHAALNGFLPDAIRVREVSPALPEFHARFSARGKVYRYTIYNGIVMDPFQRHYAYHSLYKLNVAVMVEAAKYLIGQHDFSAFATAISSDVVRNPVKTISRFDISEKGPVLELEVEGKAFLYKQVRNMVALLLQIGKEVLPPDIVPKILESRDRRELAKYAKTVPPHGLCLVEVKYEEEHMGLPLGSPAVSFGSHRYNGRCKIPTF